MCFMCYSSVNTTKLRKNLLEIESYINNIYVKNGRCQPPVYGSRGKTDTRPRLSDTPSNLEGEYPNYLWSVDGRQKKTSTSACLFLYFAVTLRSISSTICRNDLSVSIRFVTALQAWSTVAWFLPPIAAPIAERGDLVCCLHRYIAIWRA